MKGKEPYVPTVVLVGEYLAGDTLREIARRYGVSFQTLAVQLRNAGIARRPIHPRKYADRVCPTCGATFRPRYEGQRHCSRACVPRLGKHKQTHCKWGHPLTGDNLRPRYGKTPPRCIACEKANQARYRAKRKGQ